MAKTLLKNAVRDQLLKYMADTYADKHKRKNIKIRDKAVEAVNKILCAKFPESDMKVLEKYELTSHDFCLRFIDTQTQHVFGVDWRYNESKETLEMLASIPYRRGCSSGDIMPATPTQRYAIEAYESAKEDTKQAYNEEVNKYRSFLNTCRFVDEVAEVIPFTEEMKVRYMSGGALATINPETIADIKKQFAA